MYNVLAYMYILSAMFNVLEYKVHCTWVQVDLNNIEISPETEVHPVAIHSIICISFYAAALHFPHIGDGLCSTFQLGDGWIHI